MSVFNLPPPPNEQDVKSYPWNDWFNKLVNGVTSAFSRSNHTGTQPISTIDAFSSADLAGKLTDETGTGLAVFGTDPTLTRPNIDRVDMTIGAADPSWAEGQVYWNDDEHTLAVDTDVSGVNTHLGRELIVRVVNKTGAPISAHKVVYIDTAQGNRPTIVLAKADAEATSSYTIGVTVAEIADNNNGYVITNGYHSGIDTTGFSAGDKLWLSAATAGEMTATRPAAPNHAVFLGFALNSTVNGAVYLNIMNGYETTELHDVASTAPTDGQVLAWNAGASYYEPTDVAAEIKNVIDVNTVIPADTSYPVIGYLDINATLDIQGNLAILDGSGYETWVGVVGVVSKDTDYELAPYDETVFCDASAGGFTITVPSAANLYGKRYNIKKTDSTSGTITVTSTSTIDGSNTILMNGVGDNMEIISNNTNWYII